MLGRNVKYKCVSELGDIYTSYQHGNKLTTTYKGKSNGEKWTSVFDTKTLIEIITGNIYIKYDLYFSVRLEILNIENDMGYESVQGSCFDQYNNLKNIILDEEGNLGVE